MNSKYCGDFSFFVYISRFVWSIGHAFPPNDSIVFCIRMTLRFIIFHRFQPKKRRRIEMSWMNVFVHKLIILLLRALFTRAPSISHPKHFMSVRTNTAKPRCAPTNRYFVVAVCIEFYVICDVMAFVPHVNWHRSMRREAIAIYLKDGWPVDGLMCNVFAYADVTLVVVVAVVFRCHKYKITETVIN